MSRTHRAHLSPREQAKRGGKDPEKREKKDLKTPKQKRANERVRIRKDFL